MPERAGEGRKMSLEEILISVVSKSEGGGDGGIEPESSFREEFSFSRKRDGNIAFWKNKWREVEEVKLLKRFLARCQKKREVEEIEHFLHLARMKDFLASRRTDLARFWAEM